MIKLQDELMSAVAFFVSLLCTMEQSYTTRKLAKKLCKRFAESSPKLIRKCHDNNPNSGIINCDALLT